MTDDETSDRTIVNIHIILVKYIFPKISPTTSVGLIQIMQKLFKDDWETDCNT